MNQQIEPLYIPPPLQHLDQDKDGILGLNEWLRFFEAYQDDILFRKAESIFSEIVKIIFKIDHPIVLAQITTSVLMNYSDKAGRLQLDRLYDYLVSMLPPMIYAHYQPERKDLPNFFFYSGSLSKEHYEFCFVKDNIIPVTHIFHLWIAWHIRPCCGYELLLACIENYTEHYNEERKGFDASFIWEHFSDANGKLSINGLHKFSEKHHFQLEFTPSFGLFALHNDTAKAIRKSKTFSLEQFEILTNFTPKEYLFIGLKMLFDSLGITRTLMEQTHAFFEESHYFMHPKNLFKDVNPLDHKHIHREEFIDFLALNDISVY